MVGLVELLPLILFGLWGGALADAMSRRLLIMGSEAGLGLLTLFLLANSLLNAGEPSRKARNLADNSSWSLAPNGPTRPSRRGGGWRN